MTLFFFFKPESWPNVRYLGRWNRCLSSDNWTPFPHPLFSNLFSDCGSTHVQVLTTSTQVGLSWGSWTSLTASSVWWKWGGQSTRRSSKIFCQVQLAWLSFWITQPVWLRFFTFHWCLFKIPNKLLRVRMHRMNQSWGTSCPPHRSHYIQ